MHSACSFVRVGAGLRLAYAEQGPRDGRAVLFLHGYSDSHRSFDLIAPHLPETWRLIALSQRGYGRSDKPQGGYTMAQMGADALSVLDALAIDRAVLVGHSMGAAVALEAAAAQPQRIAGIVLLGAFADFAGNCGVTELAQAVVQFPDPIDPEFVLAFQEGTLAGMIPQRFLDLVISESLQCPAHVWRALAPAFLATDPLAAAQACDSPALLIRGGEDQFVPDADTGLLAAALGRAEAVTLAGVGHAPHWERPARVAALLRRFVTKLESADRDGDPYATRYGCFLPDLTGLAGRPSAACLRAPYRSAAGPPQGPAGASGSRLETP